MMLNPFSTELTKILSKFDQPNSVAQRNLIELLQNASLLRSELEKAIVEGSVISIKTLDEYGTGGSYDINKGVILLIKG